MPKLAAKVAKKVAKAEASSGEFQPLPPGKYLATLTEVEAKKSNAGAPMWVAEFEDITNSDDEVQPGRQWYNLMLPQDKMPEDYKPKRSKKSPEEAWESYQELCHGRLKAFFEAFGYSTDSDTDEFIGEQCVLQIGIRTIQNGARAGEKTNSVNAVLSAEDWESEGGSSDDDDEF